MPCKPTATKHKISFRRSCSRNYLSNYKMNSQWQENTMPASKGSRHLSKEGARLPSCYPTSSSCSHSTKQCRQQKTNLNRRLKKGATLNDHSPKIGLMAHADNAQSTCTNGQNVANVKETKHPATALRMRNLPQNHRTKTNRIYTRNSIPN